MTMRCSLYSWHSSLISSWFLPTARHGFSHYRCNWRLHSQATYFYMGHKVVPPGWVGSNMLKQNWPTWLVLGRYTCPCKMLVTNTARGCRFRCCRLVCHSSVSGDSLRWTSKPSGSQRFQPPCCHWCCHLCWFPMLNTRWCWLCSVRLQNSQNVLNLE